MNWSDPAQVAQAVFWVLEVLTFFVGYHMGNRR